MAALLAGSAGCGDNGSSGGGLERQYTVEIAVTSASRIGALQLEVNYRGRDGGFDGTGDQPDCDPLVEAVIAGNQIGETILKIGLISLQGIVTPSPILRCRVITTEMIGPNDFRIDVTDASDTNSEALDPIPTVVVSSVLSR